MHELRQRRGTQTGIGSTPTPPVPAPAPAPAYAGVCFDGCMEKNGGCDGRPKRRQGRGMRRAGGQKLERWGSRVGLWHKHMPPPPGGFVAHVCVCVCVSKFHFSLLKTHASFCATTLTKRGFKTPPPSSRMIHVQANVAPPQTVVKRQERNTPIRFSRVLRSF